MKIISVILSCCSLLIACSKNEPAAPACTSITILSSATSSDPCIPEGSIIIRSPTGGSYQYKAGGAAFQSSPTLGPFVPGSYTIEIKDAGGCISTAAVTVPEKAGGPLFTAMKNTLAANCTRCHGGINPQEGIDFNRSCDILNRWDRIKARAVDANPASMPPAGLLPVSERNKITDWVNAGHRFTD